MKNKKFNFVALSLLAGSMFFTSCNNDDATDDSTIIVNDGKATVSVIDPYIQVNATNVVNEGGYDTGVTYTVTLAAAQPVDTYVNVRVLPGATATEDVDFEYDHQVYIRAWATRGTGTITILGDNVDEGMETFTIEVGTEFDANIDVADAKFIFNITDKGDLNFTFDWGLEIPGFPLTLCDIDYDIDVFLVNADGDEVTGFDGATIQCPEEMNVAAADLGDGVYELLVNVYDDGGLATAGITPAFSIPVTTTYFRDNSTFGGVFIQDADDAIDSDFGNVVDYDTQFHYLATLTVANGNFTISQNGTTIGSGRTSNKNRVANIKKLAKSKRLNRVSFFN